MRHGLTVASIPAALVIAGVVFWYGPSAPVSCGARPTWADHYGHVDGPGGPGFEGCLAPSSVNYLLTAGLFIVIILVAALVDSMRALPTGRSSSRPGGRIYLDESGNRIPPPSD
ncbi:MAG: hypothetical protein JWL77_7055 [Chthonomonadaceae bacterium]|nr:hypothetical protein [Chthonomonadaceae bacterium]